MHNTALTHLDGVAANVDAEVWGRRYIVVRVRRPRGGCSSGGASAGTFTAQRRGRTASRTHLSHSNHCHLCLRTSTVAQTSLIVCKNISVQN